MNWGCSMALLTFGTTPRKNMSLSYRDVIELDKLDKVTKLMKTQYGSVMVYCGQEMKGFYNGTVGSLVRGLGWSI